MITTTGAKQLVGHAVSWRDDDGQICTGKVLVNVGTLLTIRMRGYNTVISAEQVLSRSQLREARKDDQQSKRGKMDRMIGTVVAWRHPEGELFAGKALRREGSLLVIRAGRNSVAYVGHEQILSRREVKAALHRSARMVADIRKAIKGV